MGTTPHGIYWPEDYETQADLPVIMGDNAQSIEDALVATDNAMADVSAAQVPLGTIIMFAGAAVAPTGWHLCDGSVHGSAALEAAIGSPNAPDLRGRFVVGVGPGYAAKATGGQEQVTLTGGQSGVPPHTHGASTAEGGAHTHGVAAQTFNTGANDVDHTHAANPGQASTSSNSHTHSFSVREGTGEGDGNYIDSNPNDGGRTFTPTGATTSSYTHSHTVDLPNFNTGANSVDHKHSVTVPAHTTGAASALHTHPVTVDVAVAAPATAPHENRPPYYALVFLIRKA